MSEPSHKSSDLACGGSALLLWGLPVAALIVGANFPNVRLLLWIPAFLVMGAACSVNAARCSRLHCYVTGPLFLLGAIYLVLWGFHVAPMQLNIFLNSIVGIALLARLAEFPLGKYRKRASGASQGSAHEC